MILSIIVAIGKNNEIGKENKLLWNLPRDMKHFRETTKGHAVIMGRKTFESIGKPLPNRRNIIVTRDNLYASQGIEISNSFEEAIKLASLDQGKKFEENENEIETFVIGGSEIYKQAIPYANKLYITHIDGSFDADTFFPEINKNIWTETQRNHFDKDEENEFSMDFVIYKKVQ